MEIYERARLLRNTHTNILYTSEQQLRAQRVHHGSTHAQPYTHAQEERVASSAKLMVKVMAKVEEAGACCVGWW